MSHTPFLSFESNSLSVTAVQECCVKESLCQSQYCGNSVFSQSQVVSANLHIFILVLCSRICSWITTGNWRPLTPLLFSIPCQFLVSVSQLKDLFKANSNFFKTKSKVCLLKCLTESVDTKVNQNLFKVCSSRNVYRCAEQCEHQYIHLIKHVSVASPLWLILRVSARITVFQHFDTSINSIEMLKFSRQFGLQG